MLNYKRGTCSVHFSFAHTYLDFDVTSLLIREIFSNNITDSNNRRCSDNR